MRHQREQQSGNGESVGSVAGRASVFGVSVPRALLLLVIAVGLFIRLQGLRGPDGDFGTDESRLALAAQGVLATGLPILPSGRIYTRGLINAYLMAPSLWMFGPHDFAGRLPSALVGALLIPVVYAFGRSVAGVAGGLCTATFAALQAHLVFWSDKAWMPSLFVLVFVGTAYLLYLGYELDRSTMQIAGALGFVTALLVHELAVLLPMAVLATLAIRTARRDFAWFSGRRSVVAFLIFGFGMALFVVLGLLLRAGTIAGAAAEFEAYVAPSLTLAHLNFYYQHLARSYPLLLVAVALGIPLALRSPKGGTLLLFVMMAVGIVTLGFLLNKSMERYGIMMLPLLAIIAAWSLVEATRLATGRWKIGHATARALPTVVLVVVFGVSMIVDLRAAMNPEKPPAKSWLAAFQALGPAPEDLVLSDMPTVLAFYRGRVDYWARIANYKRYSYVSGGDVRELYTGAIKVGNENDFQRVIDANPGRRLWYVGDLRRFYDPYNVVDPVLRARLLRSAEVSQISPHGWVILRIDLGSPRAGGRQP